MKQMKQKNLFRYAIWRNHVLAHSPKFLPLLFYPAQLYHFHIQANTQELGKDKWLCPLSGKKFKGPDFVRKHIFNKHAEKVEEVKKEVKYYNNYLKDPKRPQLPESNQKSAHSANGRGQRSDQPPQDP